MQHIIKRLLLSLIVFFSLNVTAEIRLPAIINNNMVLQQNAKDPFWGWSSPGEEITITPNWPMATAIKTTADHNGKWMVSVQVPAAGGPYSIKIKGENEITLNNVMIGEVWVCSGQSNMEMPVKGWDFAPILNSASEIKAADYPNIRLFTVKRKIAVKPEDDCSGNWVACSPETVPEFSASAYFFGRQLYQKLKVPIGLIHTSWGGTPAEAWTSNSALRKLGDFNDYLDKLDSVAPYIKDIQANYEKETKAWDEKSKQVNTTYAEASYKDDNWQTMELPTKWENAGLPDYDGIVWFRKTVGIPASWAGKKLKLDLGPIDDEDITWYNGEKVGEVQEEGHSGQDRSYDVPAKLVRYGKATISVRATDLQGGGGIYGDKNKMWLYPAGTSPDKGISLAGDWHYKASSQKPQPAFSYNSNSPSVLYNGMIAPIIPFGMRGVIWYQGENNVGRAAQYAKLFPAMISNWRNKWNEGNFPFYFVQIAPYHYGGEGTQAAALRDAQRKTLSLPNTGMVVTLDIGNVKNIHPANKEEVGRRLSLWALGNTYNKDNVVYSGPLYKSMQVQGNKIIVSFDHAGDGLMAKGGDLNSFEIAGKDGHFVPAKATISGEQVIVQADGVDNPTAVRYGWTNTAEPHLFNKAGLPASSFSTAD